MEVEIRFSWGPGLFDFGSLSRRPQALPMGRLTQTEDRKPVRNDFQNVDFTQKRFAELGSINHVLIRSQSRI